MPERQWPPELPEITFTSSFDRTTQRTMLHTPDVAAGPAPLLVALHTWSFGLHMPGHPYYNFCRARNWAFLYPDFRGRNDRPEAGGSPAAMQDIADAVALARERIDIDPERIYLAGSSGGGHMSLMMAAHYPELWAGVSCSVPINDLALWHGESRERGNGYADMLERLTGGAPGASAAVDAEYRRRSPCTALADVRGRVTVDILAGIHDGHTGSVPIRHALGAFNLLAGEADRIAIDDIEFMVREECAPPALAGCWPDPEFGEKVIHFRRVSGSARVTIFEGGHEMVPAAMLNFLARQRRGRAADYSVPDRAEAFDADGGAVSG